MVNNIAELEAYIATAKKELFSHSLYKTLNSVDALTCFMSHHVYAVWDFMNLLSYLQSIYTSVRVPWSPPKFPELTRLINEIKLEEESDIINGNVTSHFDFYMLAMKNLGINLKSIESFVSQIKNEKYETLITNRCVPKSVQAFLFQTKKAIEKGPVSAAASFTFGRETIIPKMFLKILKNAKLTTELDGFKSYIERHIELDGEAHGDLSLQLVSEICGKNPSLWEEAAETAQLAIQARIDLYSNIEMEIKNRHDS